jgi:hypothetical protein
VLIRTFYIAASLIGAFYLPSILSAMAVSRELTQIEK